MDWDWIFSLMINNNAHVNKKTKNNHMHFCIQNKHRHINIKHYIIFFHHGFVFCTSTVFGAKSSYYSSCDKLLLAMQTNL